MDAPQYKTFISALRRAFEDHCEELCRLDALAGDGDHGLTILRGIQAAEEAVRRLDDQAPPAECFKESGFAMLKAMGGASGPIFSTLFIQMAIGLRETGLLDGSAFYAILLECKDALIDLTGTQPGQKTMIDALEGALRALSGANASEMSFSKALQAAAQGAQQGADQTREMLAQQGRAKFLGERSKGFYDAGACSVSLIFKVMAENLS